MATSAENAQKFLDRLPQHLETLMKQKKEVGGWAHVSGNALHEILIDLQSGAINPRDAKRIVAEYKRLTGDKNVVLKGNTDSRRWQLVRTDFKV